MAKQYVLALVNKENGVFGIHFPDYQGCVSGGSTFEEAVSRGANALVFHLQGMADDGDPISAPRQAEEALASVRDELAGRAMPAIIEVEFPRRAVRVNISIEESLLSQVDKAATSSGQSRSAFLADAARVRLRNAG